MVPSDFDADEPIRSDQEMLANQRDVRLDADYNVRAER